MQIIYGNKQLTIENNQSSISEIFEKVNEIINKKNIVFSHLNIDNKEIYEGHENYIQENLNEIMTVEIITKHAKEMVWETMESIYNYLQRAIPELNKLIDESYKFFTSETWVGIENLAEGMQWILQFSEVTSNLKQYPIKWTEIKSSVVACELSFVQLMEGVEEQDMILISDILSYEVTPALEKLKEALEVTLQDKEFLKDVN